MAKDKKNVHRVEMTEGKRNIIRQLLEEYDIQKCLRHPGSAQRYSGRDDQRNDGSRNGQPSGISKIWAFRQWPLSQRIQKEADIVKLWKHEHISSARPKVHIWTAGSQEAPERHLRNRSENHIHVRKRNDNASNIRDVRRNLWIWGIRGFHGFSYEIYSHDIFVRLNE